MDLPAANPFNLPPQVNINHRGGVTNALYVDGHARAFAYDPDFFLFRRQDYAGPIQGLMKREDNILIRLDYAMTGDPADAPQLP
jgi:prepilin-type processing-associated H-X9-DG protein